MNRRSLRASAAIVAAAALLLTMSSVTPAVGKGPAPKTISFDSSEFTLWEGHPTGKSVGFGLTRSVKTGTPSVTVTIGSETDSAVFGVDYTAPQQSMTFTFPRNQRTITEAAIITALSEGDLWENDETITLTLSDPSSKWSLGTPSTATVTIHEEPAPPAPIDVAATPFGTDGIDVSWALPSTWPGTGYPPGYPLIFTVERSIDLSPGSWTMVDQTTNFSVLDLGLDPGTTYWYHVRVTNAEGSSDTSDDFSGTTLPLAPTPTCSAVVDNFDPSVVHVEWSIPSDYVGSVYFRVFSSWDLETWTPVTEGWDIYLADDTDLTEVPYWYKVTAEAEEVAGTAESEPCGTIS